MSFLPLYTLPLLTFKNENNQVQHCNKWKCICFPLWVWVQLMTYYMLFKYIYFIYLICLGVIPANIFHFQDGNVWNKTSIASSRMNSLMCADHNCKRFPIKVTRTWHISAIKKKEAFVVSRGIYSFFFFKKGSQWSNTEQTHKNTQNTACVIDVRDNLTHHFNK